MPFTGVYANCSNVEQKTQGCFLFVFSLVLSGFSSHKTPTKEDSQSVSFERFIEKTEALSRSDVNQALSLIENLPFSLESQTIENKIKYFQLLSEIYLDNLRTI